MAAAARLQVFTVDRLNSAGQSRTYEFTDSLSWVKGRHAFKFGLDAMKMRAVDALGFFGADNYGTYGFNGMFTGYDFADFLIGAPAAIGLGQRAIGQRWPKLHPGLLCSG